MQEDSQSLTANAADAPGALRSGEAEPEFKALLDAAVDAIIVIDHRGHVEQFLTVPLGAETCGPLITDDGRSVFVAVQHPGEVDGSTFENPSSTWPHTHGCPRPSVVVAYKP